MASGGRAYVLIWILPALFGAPPGVRCEDPCQTVILTLRHPELRDESSTTTGEILCDRDTIVPGRWYRASPLDDVRLADRCPDVLKCGTYFPMWISGTHPTDDVVVKMSLFIHLDDNCTCWTSADGSNVISVKRCEAQNEQYFYIYQLPNPTGCPFGFCTHRPRNLLEGGDDPVTTVPATATTSTSTTTTTAATTTTATTTTTAARSTVKLATTSQGLTTDEIIASASASVGEKSRNVMIGSICAAALILIIIVITVIILLKRNRSRSTEKKPIGDKDTKDNTYLKPKLSDVTSPGLPPPIYVTILDDVTVMKHPYDNKHYESLGVTASPDDAGYSALQDIRRPPAT